MPFEIVRNDITNMQVDAIVNTANPRPIIGAGVDTMIHKKAGPQLLLARQKIGDIPRGDAAITPAYGLHAEFVIHTVGPVWQGGGHGEAATLYSCYDRALALAVEHGCQSIAFPLIATGAYGFPRDLALRIAVDVFSKFLLEQEIQIYLVVFDKASYRLSEKLFSGISSYIDEHYAEAYLSRAARDNRRRTFRSPQQSVPDFYAMPDMCAPCGQSASGRDDLNSFLKRKDAGFTQTLLELIQKKGLKNSTVYKKANISKQHFSKIINDPAAKPSKQTAIALALALELDLAGTRDLIGRAGYALTNSSIFDLIIQYHIEHRNYNVIEINIALYEFDQSLLGA